MSDQSGPEQRLARFADDALARARARLTRAQNIGRTPKQRPEQPASKSTASIGSNSSIKRQWRDLRALGTCLGTFHAIDRAERSERVHQLNARESILIAGIAKKSAVVAHG